jgi:hypothetical protein
MEQVFPVSARATVVGLLFVALALPSWAQAPSTTQPVTGISMTTRETAEGQITAVDQKARMVTVKLSDGRTVSGKVSEAVGGLDLVKVGDRVDAAFEEKMSFVLSAPGTTTPTNRAVSGLATSGSGEMPAGYMASYAVSSWLVVRTDTVNNTISLVEPAGGQILAFDVRTPEGRASLPRVKAGDRLTAVKAEFLFARVTRKP